MLICMYACEYRKKEIIPVPMGGAATGGGGGSTGTGSSGTDTCSQQVSYKKSIRAILNTTCAIPGGCHTNMVSWGDYTGYAGVKAKADAGVLLKRIEQRTMPPSYTNGPKSLSDCQIQQFRSWIASGAPEN